MNAVTKALVAIFIGSLSGLLADFKELLVGFIFPCC